ncbi:MAG: hypothetical protein U5Q03_17970 [Bacteroidota bacterium]|nr:hypothetical protein [Bacteroidota bacterium]
MPFFTLVKEVVFQVAPVAQTIYAHSKWVKMVFLYDISLVIIIQIGKSTTYIPEVVLQVIVVPESSIALFKQSSPGSC